MTFGIRVIPVVNYYLFSLLRPMIRGRHGAIEVGRTSNRITLFIEIKTLSKGSSIISANLYWKSITTKWCHSSNIWNLISVCCNNQLFHKVIASQIRYFYSITIFFKLKYLSNLSQAGWVARGHESHTDLNCSKYEIMI